MTRKPTCLTPEITHRIWSHWKEGDRDEDDILRRILPPVQTKSALKDDVYLELSKIDSGNISKDTKNLVTPVTNMSFLTQHAVQLGKVRWVDDVIVALHSLGGEANLPAIYKEVVKIRQAAGRSVVKSLDATVRQTIEAHSIDSKNYREGNGDYFSWIERGRWKLK